MLELQFALSTVYISEESKQAFIRQFLRGARQKTQNEIAVDRKRARNAERPVFGQFRNHFGSMMQSTQTDR